MPSRRVHTMAGGVAGATYAAVRSRTESPAHQLLESIGGVVGGIFGGRLPDVFDPPMNPWHRSLGHAVVPTAIAGRFIYDSLDETQRWLRAKATEFDQRARYARTESERLWCVSVAAACRLVSGIIAGFLAGYGSHLLLDALTPRSVPVFG